VLLEMEQAPVSVMEWMWSTEEPLKVDDSEMK
jgi:hypothetical protein